MTSKTLYSNVAAGGAVVWLVFGPTAQADVTISSAATQSMSCSGGVCAPTAASAVLNTAELESMLASGNVSVTTTGAGIEATNINIKASFAWSSAATLTLDAYQSIAVAKHISIAGPGGLAVVTDNGGKNGTLSFGETGRVSFSNLSSSLTINGEAYTLVKNVKSLASAIATDATGYYALSDNYDAKKDGTYSSTPIPTVFVGTLEGLGNTISNIHVHADHQQKVGGLLYEVDFGGLVENLGLAALALKMGRFRHGVTQAAGGFVMLNEGSLFNDRVSGSMSVNAVSGSTGSQVGGMAAATDGGKIENSYSDVQISAPGADAGGLVGDNFGGLISESFSTGSVKAANENGETPIGGLVAINDGGTIVNSYATGTVAGEGNNTPVGGLIGIGSGSASVSTSYSIGKVTDTGGLVGGFIGRDFSSASNNYWDTQTSGTEEGTGDGNVVGITGQTSKQFKRTLPTGFDPSIWTQDKKINKGFPYLINNPPRGK